MNEIIFLVEDAIEGGFTARALGESIFTEGDDRVALRANIRDAVDCHFDTESKPKMIRLHFVSEEVIAASGFRETFPEQNLSGHSESSATKRLARLEAVFELLQTSAANII